MRVISGKYKGRKLMPPPDEKVRPTTDRIKETLFNILSSKGLAGEITALDLFGGSGAVGIESLSRGAQKVVFIDRSPESVKLIKYNLNHVGASEENYEIYTVDFAFALKKLKGKKFDFIFADPPYDAKFEESIAFLVKKYDLLSQNGVLVIEHNNQVKFKTDGYVVEKRDCGYTQLSFLEYIKESSHNE